MTKEVGGSCFTDLDSVAKSFPNAKFFKSKISKKMVPAPHLP
jgi:hypothetical protein